VQFEDHIVVNASTRGSILGPGRIRSLFRLWWELEWEQIGHANNVVAMAAINNKLFCATKDNSLWWRDPVGWEVNWDRIGHANNVVAMAAINNKLFCATNDNRLWWRDPVL
jgi:hypothetical protein